MNLSEISKVDADTGLGAIVPTDANSRTFLEVRDLWVDGRSNGQWQEIVRGVSLTLGRGEVLGIIGESGAGKSTVGLAAIGYERSGCRIRSGSIRFDGIDLATATERQKRELWGRRIAFVAQSAAASLNPAHRLIDQCIEGPILHGLMNEADARDNAVSLYRKLFLPQPETIGTRYPHQVSGGQLQRVMIAMAMSCKPDLIIFDEPTTALDVTTQVEVLVAIRELVRSFGTAAMYISHDLALVAQMADRIMVLRHGRMVEMADTRTMMTAPKEAYTRSLWAVRSLAKSDAVGKDVLLQVDHLDAAYQSGRNVLNAVSVSICRGRSVAVVGESGSGKSTLARVIMGLLPPIRGRVWFDGGFLPSQLKDRSKETLRHLQMIYQMPDTALNPRRRVSDILGRPLATHMGLRGQKQHDRVDELMGLVELESSVKERLPGELSGGQKQRVCIARALAMQPKLIVCDEITSALDQVVAEGILKLLLRIQEETGVSYLFITHDLVTVKAIADEVVVMHQGAVVQSGLRRDVFSPPSHPYTSKLLGSVPQMDPDWLDRFLSQRRDLSNESRQ